LKNGQEYAVMEYQILKNVQTH